MSSCLFASIFNPGLLKIEGNSTAAQTGDKKTKVSESDSEYVKIAKTGGHSGMLASYRFLFFNFFWLFLSFYVCLCSYGFVTLKKCIALISEVSI